jgi:hypothetical protein
MQIHSFGASNLISNQCSTIFHKHCFLGIDHYCNRWLEDVGKVEPEGMDWKNTLVEVA